MSSLSSVSESIGRFVQQTAFHCWSNIVLMGLYSSTVRGRSLKSDSMTREATTGSATTCCISWPMKLVTSCGVSSRHDRMVWFTRPFMVSFLSEANPLTTRLEWPTIPATLVTQWVTTMDSCSQRTTETMTSVLLEIVQNCVQVVSGTKIATTQVWLCQKV